MRGHEQVGVAASSSERNCLSIHDYLRLRLAFIVAPTVEPRFLAEFDLNFVEEFIEISKKSDDADLLADELLKRTKRLGYDKMVALILGSLHSSRDNSFFAFRYPGEWVDYYTEQDYQHIDPYLRQVLKGQGPFDWQEHIEPLKRENQLLRNQLVLLEEGKSVGIAQGFSVPVENDTLAPSCISFCGSDVDRTAGARHMLHLMSLYFHSALKRLKLGDTEPAGFPKLSMREIEVLQWFAVGKSAWDISQLLDISEATVRFHMANIRKKYRVTSTVHAATIAVSRSQISL